MAIHFDVTPSFEDNRFAGDEESRTNGSDVGFSVVLLLSDDLESVVEGFVGVGNEVDSESTALVKFSVGCFIVDRNTDYLDSKCLEFSFEPCERLRFHGTSWSVVGRIKIENSLFRSRKEKLDTFLFDGSVWMDEIIKIGFHRSFGLQNNSLL